MNDYSIEQGYQAACKHDAEYWLIDDVPGPPMIICSACGATLAAELTLHIPNKAPGRWRVSQNVTGALSKTTYLDMNTDYRVTST